VSNFSKNKKQKYDFYEVFKPFLLTGALTSFVFYLALASCSCTYALV
jgi:hypothetical protein